MSEMERGLILLIGYSKGGVTKSTLCENLSVEFARRGYRVSLVDADHRQRTLKKWADRRNESIENGADWPYIPCDIQQGNISKDILEKARNYDLVIVDTGGRDSIELRYALTVADIVYVPIQVSQNCTESMEEFEEILMETGTVNPERRAYGIIVDAPTHPSNREKLEAKEFLEEFKSTITLSRLGTKHRTSYRIAPRTGATVIEGTDSAAKAEIQLLAQEILSHATAEEITA